MANSYISCYIHYVFSTKNRQNIITREIEERLWPYIGGIARENKMKALAIGGVENHHHLLISLPSTITIAKAIQQLKGSSSEWINETFRLQEKFYWQEGYGAFSVSASQLEKVKTYIKRQKEHHKKKTFKEEYLGFLKKYHVDYNEKYLWG